MPDTRLHPRLWGGVECTVNRVHDTFFDQMTRSGHPRRVASDLALFAGLGMEALRTPLLWETFAATGNWNFPDALIRETLRLGIRPIAGLLHHGSGPPSTDLLDPEFPQKLAAYAGAVAARYPEILDYTPVNEPQTTGRFACLYGHWFPHHRSMGSYVRALHNEIKGIALAMTAIRRVQPGARLIHTEDGGVTYAPTPLEAFRLEREHRRWLGTDLLCGRVTAAHPCFTFLLAHGLSEAEILWFAEHPCPPSVLGLNYYVTSDRYLDPRLALHPGYCGGDTGSEPLADVDAVRVHPGGITGAGAILRQAWDRYGLPVAITEAHLGSDPHQQMRWLAEIWEAAKTARADGVEVEAVTVWALLGSHNWPSLCTADTGMYEPGVFDLREGDPLATPLANLVYRLGQDLPLDPALKEGAWWRSTNRLTLPPVVDQHEPMAQPEEA